MSQIKFLSAKNILNLHSDLTETRPSESVNRNFCSALSSVLSIFLLFGFVCHPQPSKSPADKARLAASACVLGSLSAIYPAMQKPGQHKGGMNYGLLQPRQFFSLSWSQAHLAQYGWLSFLFSVLLSFRLLTSYFFNTKDTTNKNIVVKIIDLVLISLAVLL